MSKRHQYDQRATNMSSTQRENPAPGSANQLAPI